MNSNMVNNSTSTLFDGLWFKFTIKSKYIVDNKFISIPYFSYLNNISRSQNFRYHFSLQEIPLQGITSSRVSSSGGLFSGDIVHNFGYINFLIAYFMGIASSWAATYFSCAKTILSNTLQINNSLNLQFTLICVRIKIRYFCHTSSTSFLPLMVGSLFQNYIMKFIIKIQSTKYSKIQNM